MATALTQEQFERRMLAAIIGGFAAHLFVLPAKKRRMKQIIEEAKKRGEYIPKEEES